LARRLNNASLAISVVGRTGRFFGATILLPLCFPDTILKIGLLMSVDRLLLGQGVRQIGKHVPQ